MRETFHNDAILRMQRRHYVRFILSPMLASLVALLVQDLYSFVLEDAVAVFGMTPAYIQGTVLVIAIALIFYARGAKSRRLLN